MSIVKSKQNGVEIADIASPQVITNKDVDGGTASDTSRITVPKDTTANLDSLIRKEATIVYDTTTQTLKVDNGTALVSIGSGGGEWGDITGTLADQTDLQNALDAKATSSALTAHETDTTTHGVTGDIVGTSDSQVLSNKDIDGGTAANNRRITLPKDTTSNLDALTRKEGTIVYDTDTKTVRYDDGVDLKPMLTYIPALSDFQNYTPATDGLGTVTWQTSRYRQIADGFEFEFKGTIGSSTGVQAKIYLPPGYVISSTYGSGYHNFGDIAGNFSAAGGIFLIGQPGDNFFSIGTSIGTPGLTPQNGSTILGSGNVISGSTRVKIAGLTSGFTTTDTIGQVLPVRMSATKTGGLTPSGFTPEGSWTSKVDDFNAFDLTTGIFTVPRDGDYQCSYGQYLITSVSLGLGFHLNRTVGTDETVWGTGSSYSGTGLTIFRNCKVGDQIHVISSTGTQYGLDTLRFDIERVSTPNTLMNIRKISYIKDIRANNTPGGSSTASTWVTRPLNTVEDTSGIITTFSSNQFTLQPGSYDINGRFNYYRTGGSRYALYNVTDSVYVFYGDTEYQTDSIDATFHANLAGSVTISSTKTFEIRAYHTTVSGGAGVWGQPRGMGSPEQYATLKIEKIS